MNLILRLRQSRLFRRALVGCFALLSVCLVLVLYPQENSRIEIRQKIPHLPERYQYHDRKSVHFDGTLIVEEKEEAWQNMNSPETENIFVIERDYGLRVMLYRIDGSLMYRSNFFQPEKPKSKSLFSKYGSEPFGFINKFTIEEGYLVGSYTYVPIDEILQAFGFFLICLWFYFKFIHPKKKE